MTKALLGLVCAAGVAVAGLYIYKGVVCNVAADDSLPSCCASQPVAASSCCSAPSRAELVAATKPSCCADAATLAVAAKPACCADGASPVAAKEGCCGKCKAETAEVLTVAPREVK